MKTVIGVNGQELKVWSPKSGRPSADDYTKKGRGVARGAKQRFSTPGNQLDAARATSHDSEAAILMEHRFRTRSKRP